jgi:hypothetical protein
MEKEMSLTINKSQHATTVMAGIRSTLLEGSHTDELFMAWYYAKFTNKIKWAAILTL